MNLNILVNKKIKKSQSDGFVLIEVLAVVALIGMVFSSFLLLEQAIIKSFRKAQNKQFDMIKLNNAKYIIGPLFGDNFLDRDQKIEEMLSDEKNDEKIKYKIKVVIKKDTKEEKEDSAFGGLPRLSEVSLSVVQPSDSELPKRSISFFVYNMSQEDSEKKK